MAATQRLLAIAMALLSISAGAHASGTLDVVGVVVQANHASLGSQEAVEGTTIYDGDRLSTDAEGTLRLMIGQAVLHLAERSSAVVRDGGARGSDGPRGKQFEVELLAGTAVLSVTTANRGEIVACLARVRSVLRERGVVRVQILGPQELLVYAQRGDAEISYRDETESVPEGKAVRVLLNAQDDRQGGGTAKAPGHRNKRIVIVTIAASGALAAGLILALRGSHAQAAVESPDKP